jgi:long-chain acyl-CoA synthetase
LLPNNPDFVTWFFAVLWSGHAALPLPTTVPPAGLAPLLADAGVETIISTQRMAPVLDALRSLHPPLKNVHYVETAVSDRSLAEPQPKGEAAVLLYTSGTTGVPKGVLLSDKNLLSNAEDARIAGRMQPEERLLGVLPFYHAYGLTVTMLLPIVYGGTCVTCETLNPAKWLELIEKLKVSVLVFTPSLYGALLRARMPARADSLRLCISGGEPLSAAVAAEFERRFGRKIFPGYGATEAAPVISMNRESAWKAGTVGQPLPSVQCEIRDEAGQKLGPSDIGELWVKGPNVMLGYHNRAEETSQRLRKGWYCTGDLASLDENHFLTLAGRKDDLIKHHGEKVYPSEVEPVLETVEGVEQAVVVGLRDQEAGEVPVAFVLPRPEAIVAEAQLRAACRERLAAYQIPRRFVISHDLPRRPPLNKLARRDLIAWAVAQKLL